METYIHHCRCVTIALPSGIAISCGGIRFLIRWVQHRSGCKPWDGIYAEAFRGQCGSLILARPAVYQRAEIADYVFPLIHKYFTD